MFQFRFDKNTLTLKENYSQKQISFNLSTLTVGPEEELDKYLTEFEKGFQS